MIEHTVDSFWLLGIGNVNCSGRNTNSYFKDQNYDTSIFDNVFSKNDIWLSNSSRMKFNMNADGSTSSTAAYYWLCSASSYDGSCVGCVDTDGSVIYSSARGFYGCSPACIIG